MYHRRILFLALLAAIACESPVAPESCGPTVTIEAIVGHPVRQQVCFSTPGGGALTYTATSSSPDVVTVTISGTTLTVTGRDEGTAEITVTAVGPGGGTGTVVYPVVSEHAWEGEIRECSAESIGNDLMLVIDGLFKANIALSNVTHSAGIGDLEMTGVFIGQMAADTQTDFGAALWVTELSGGDECWQRLDYVVAGH